MRKRNILLAAIALAAGLTAIGTLVAQQPQLPSSGRPPVQPYDKWTPNSGPGASGVQQAGGMLPPPAGYAPANLQPNGGVVPVSGTLPPPNLDIMNLPPPTITSTPTIPTAPASPPAGLPPSSGMAPPSVWQDPVGAVSSVPLVTSTPPKPLVPVPGTGAAGVSLPPSMPIVPLPASGQAFQPTMPVPPTVTSVPTAPVVSANPQAPSVPALPNGTDPATPGVMPIKPTVQAPVTTNALPGRVVQNVVLETLCPESVVFGQEFRYELVVKNVGNVAATGVKVDDELPSGARYVGSDPPAEMNGDRLTWMLGGLDAGAEKRIVIRVKPIEEGEVRSRATLSFATSVDARTKVTRPRVSVAVNCNEVCRAGDETILQIKVGNSGTGPAQRMILQAKLSDGLLHPQGMVIEAELANLPPGEIKTIPLKVSAAKAGLQWCQITVAADGSPDATAKASLNVVEPLLQVTQTGPAKCHVRAEPSYEITLSNPGTAQTDPISLYSVLPECFEFVQANENGAYVAANRAIVWKLPSLPPGGTKTVSLKLRAASAGDGMLRTIAQSVPEAPVIGQAGAGAAPVRPTGRILEQKTETAIKAEGVAAIKFEVTDLEDPVEVGKEAVYEIRVTNQGTGNCTNVQLVAALAEGTTYTGSSGPTQVKAQGQHLIFDPIQQLGVKGEVVYRVRVKSSVAGDMRFRVQLSCDQVRTPVVKEESTSFYKE